MGRLARITLIVGAMLTLSVLVAAGHANAVALHHKHHGNPHFHRVVTPDAPVWHQATCAQPQGSVDIPTETGVEYALDFIPGPGGNYQLGLYPPTHTVMAVPATGYIFTGGSSVVEWTFTVVDVSKACLLINPVPHQRSWASPPPIPSITH